ncbi:uncharacterized protein LOC119616078 [Lucilia sericata]|uniref:uncharacterized protein LOC119616078 n=1 Tax=Lucilia sericata TaxID=13632 RepID=UPI0018A80E84|nr:uncharacterized protein LOC119616078 [Lucilia sericata]
MDDEVYRHQFRHNFMGHVKNPKLQQKIRENYLNESSAQYIKEQSAKAQQKIHELDSNIAAKQRSLNQTSNNGGDADRLLHYPTHVTHHSSDSYRQRSMSDNYCLKQLQSNPKPSAPALNSNSSRKYHSNALVDDCIGDHRFIYENDSNLGGLGGNGSEDSAKSQKSSKTVVSRKSSHDLRKMVTSQCKLHEVIDETLKQMCNTEVDTTGENHACGLQEQPSTQYPLTLGGCKHCTDRLQTVQSQKDVMTEIGKGDFLDCRNTDTLTISLDDVVNSKVINPMIRKLQRMYLNNLKEEMSLMEDLERMPYKVSEVYKAAIFKKKD